MTPRKFFITNSRIILYLRYRLMGIRIFCKIISCFMLNVMDVSIIVSVLCGFIIKYSYELLIVYILLKIIFTIKQNDL